MISKEKKYDVIGIGGAAWDFLGIVGNYPQPGDKAQLLEFDEQGGGQVGTAIVTVARLGGKGAIIGTTGDDEYGKKIRKSFIDEGVDNTYLISDPGKTSHIAFCMIPKKDGNRAIFYSRGTKRYLTPEDIDKDLIKSSSCLLIDTHHWKAAQEASKVARENGIPVVTDIEKDTPGNDKLFYLGTHHILPERYLLEYMKEKGRERAVEIFLKKYNPVVLVITLGEKGSIAYNKGEVIYQNSCKIEPVIDTTGAGDVFHGAFAYGLTLGYELKDNLKFASLVAGLKCRKIGGRAGIPARQELLEFHGHPG